MDTETQGRLKVPNSIGAVCNHCGSKDIYLSRYQSRDVLTCLTCGENEESKLGISINGKGKFRTPKRYHKEEKG